MLRHDWQCQPCHCCLIRQVTSPIGKTRDTEWDVGKPIGLTSPASSMELPCAASYSPWEPRAILGLKAAGGRCSPLRREHLLPSVFAAWKALEPMTQGQHPRAALVSASPAPRAGEGVVFLLNMVSRASHSWLSLKAVLEVDLAGSLFTLAFTEKAVGCRCPGRSPWHSLGKQHTLANN